MERLLEDAEKLKKANGELVEYSIDSYADIVDAIHVVQTEMGITGTTAKEASTTIQGSFGMMKAAWTNFLTGMADGNQDFDKLLDNLLDSVVTFGKNIGPRLLETLPRLVKGLGELAKKLIPYIPKAMKFLLPGLVNGARMILKEVVDNLPSILEALLGSTGRKIGEVLSKSLKEIVPALLDFAEDVLPIIVNALEFLADNFEEIVTVVGLAVAAFETMSIVNTVTTAIKGASSAFGALNSIMAANPIGMVVTAVGSLAVGISALTSLFGDNTEIVSENLRVLREETEQASENLKNYREMKSAINEKIAAQLSEVNNTERLWKELLTLRDAQGNVNEADKERAQFIINELNSAIGTEIEIVGNHIDITEEDIDTINRLIEAKKAEIYLKANEEAYAEAIQNIRQAEIDATEKYIQTEELRKNKMDEVSKLRLLKAKAETEGLTEELDTQIRQQEAYTNEVIAQYDEAYAAYEKNKNFMIACQQDIDAYESASIEIQKGNYDKAIQMLDNKGQAYLRAADLGRQATEEEKQQFLEQAQAATNYYRFIRENYEKGMEGFTQEMVANAEKNMEIAWQEYSSVGGAMVDGITAGANSQSSIINEAIMNIVRNAMVAGQSAATGSSYTAPSSAARTETNRKNNYGSRYTKTERGGVVDKGKIAFLEGHGTEAIVPLENNRAWVSKVAADMDNALGGTSNAEMMNLMSSMNYLINNLPDMMADAMCSVKVGLDKREVGRMVRQVNV